MPQSLIRLGVLVLIPGLVLGPSWAVARPAFCVSPSVPLPVFDQQAVASHLIAAFRKKSDGEAVRVVKLAGVKGGADGFRLIDKALAILERVRAMETALPVQGADEADPDFMQAFASTITQI